MDHRQPTRPHTRQLTRPLGPTAVVALAVALSGFVPGARAQGASDTIVRTDGVRVRGVQVVAFELGAVKFQRAKDSPEVAIPPQLVADVRWGGAPVAFASAMAAMQRGDFATARQQFGAASNATKRPLLKAEARLLQGRAAVARAALDPAAAASGATVLRAWLADYPRHWRVPEAMLLYGRAQRLLGLHREAEAALNELDARAARDGWNAEWIARARCELALCLLDQGKPHEARRWFQAAGSAADAALATPGGTRSEAKALRVYAHVGEGETLVREKDYARAGEFFRALAQDADAALAAAGRAGEGEVLFLGAAADAAQLRRAQVRLAEACVLDPGATDASAKACYYLGRVLRALGERDGPDWQARSAQYFQLVTRNHPGSRWAAAALAESGK